MRSLKEIIKKRKKLRARLKEALKTQSSLKIKDNCKYWVPSIAEEAKCVFNKVNNNGDCRTCPNSENCADFTKRWTDADIDAKYETLSKDKNYLARGYRDLFILEWVLEGENEEAAKKKFSWRRFIGLEVD